MVDYTDQDGDRHIETFKRKKEADPDHAKDNRVFVIHFDDAPARGGFGQCFGYAAKWAKYRVGEVELSTDERPLEETGEPVQALLDRHREQIAEAMGVLPEAVEIRVNLVYADKNGRTRSAFIR